MRPLARAGHRVTYRMSPRFSAFLMFLSQKPLLSRWACANIHRNSSDRESMPKIDSMVSFQCVKRLGGVNTSPESSRRCFIQNATPIRLSLVGLSFSIKDSDPTPRVDVRSYLFSIGKNRATMLFLFVIVTRRFPE